jgi:hypothetical protein
MMIEIFFSEIPNHPNVCDRIELKKGCYKKRYSSYVGPLPKINKIKVQNMSKETTEFIFSTFQRHCNLIATK